MPSNCGEEGNYQAWFIPHVKNTWKNPGEKHPRWKSINHSPSGPCYSQNVGAGMVLEKAAEEQEGRKGKYLPVHHCHLGEPSSGSLRGEKGAQHRQGWGIPDPNPALPPAQFSNDKAAKSPVNCISLHFPPDSTASPQVFACLGEQEARFTHKIISLWFLQTWGLGSAEGEGGFASSYLLF